MPLQVSHELVFEYGENFPWNIDEQSPGAISGRNAADIPAAAFSSNGNTAEYVKIVGHHTHGTGYIPKSSRLNARFSFGC